MTRHNLTIMDVLHRQPAPEPWAEGEKIPWDEPGFSARMLKEHLSQAHDLASRRFELIDQHVSWIHSKLLGGRSSHILDLGCGPGFYSNRLARLGHHCVGIDFSPASIEYARRKALAETLSVSYLHQDIRQANFGAGFDLVMFIFGELNAFRPESARLILQKAWAALAPGGQLLLEVSTFEGVKQIGCQPPGWYTAESGLWSDRPHMCLSESFWDDVKAAATERYFIIDGQTGAVMHCSASTQAYTEVQYRDLLDGCGFGEITFYPSLGESLVKGQEGLMAIKAIK